MTALDGVWLLLGLMAAAALVAPRPNTGDSLGLRRFRAEVSDRYRVTQRFTMAAQGLNGIEIRAAAMGPVSGSFRLTLRDREAAGVERTADVAAADLVRAKRYLFRFEPIEKSAGREYQLDIAPSPSSPGRGVALWATRGERPPERALRINDVPRWGSLAFQTQTSSVPVMQAMLRPRDPGRPPQWLALAGLLATWVALRFVLRDVMTADGARPGAPAADAPGFDAIVAATAAASPPDGLAVPPAAVR